MNNCAPLTFTETTELSSVFAVSLPPKTLMIYLLVLLINLLTEHSPSAGEPVPEQRAPGKCSVPRPGHFRNDTKALKSP